MIAHRQLLSCLGLAFFSGLAPLPAQTISLQYGMDTSLPQPKKEFVSSIGQEDLRKKVGVNIVFENIVALQLDDGRTGYLRIRIDPPAGFRPDMPLFVGSGGHTSTMRYIQTVRFLGRKNSSTSVPPWNEEWSYLRAVAR